MGLFRRFKSWFYNKFLPFETKEMYMNDLNNLLKCNKEQAQEIRELRAYIEGVQDVIKSRARIEIRNEVSK